MTNSSSSNYRGIGNTGEDLVAQWLKSTGWTILHRQWSCRWGEIDIIAEYVGKQQSEVQIRFVEVKTRSRGNWDRGGRDAITEQKKEKICRTAQMFLAEYADKVNYQCQFDVAIVQYCSRDRLHKNLTHGSLSLPKASDRMITSLMTAEYEFTLQDYIQGAFEFN
ncbi:MAG: YraN family protein [Cyanobacteria bacterium P01_A01_bin.84]